MDKFLILPADLAWSETQALRTKLWELLTKQTRAYTNGNSSSIPLETAQELLCSICFTLTEVCQAKHIPIPELENWDLEKLLRQGQQIIADQVLQGRQLWENLCLNALAVKNLALQSTLKNLRIFFKYYDRRFLAHQIPACLDYQLGQPVPESYLGIKYINQYLHRLSLENQLLQKFNLSAIIQLLQSFGSNYAELLLNICEPVLENALGLLLLDKYPFNLQIRESDQQKITQLLNSQTEAETRLKLSQAARQLCLESQITSEAATAYFEATVLQITPRLKAASINNNLANIFRSF